MKTIEKQEEIFIFGFICQKRILKGVKTPYHELIREGAKIIGIYAGQDDGGARTFFAKKNEGAKTFFEEKNDGAIAFFDEKNDGAGTFFVRIHIHSFFCY